MILSSVRLAGRVGMVPFEEIVESNNQRDFNVPGKSVSHGGTKASFRFQRINLVKDCVRDQILGRGALLTKCTSNVRSVGIQIKE